MTTTATITSKTNTDNDDDCYIPLITVGPLELCKYRYKD